MILAAATFAAAQQQPDDRSTARPPAARQLPVWDGPPAPIPPNVINRDDQGRATIRAFRVDQPPVFDGRLDDEIYRTVPGASGFIQALPREGAPASEPTDVWILFDDKNLYVSARCYDSHPERQIVNELRRDNASGINGNEGLSLGLDTFFDRRNGYSFQTNALGMVRDQAVADNRANDSWNTVWDVRTRRDENGWTAEFVIPFKSLRYPGAGPQVWGITVRRYVRWSNEISHLTRVSGAFGSDGVNQVNLYATLVGLETPAQSLTLEVKPYVISTVTTDRTATVPLSNDLTGAAGLDLKYGLTRGLTADITVNTDFAQVEEDLQQVNLTRFSLFFDEKRDFFLEGIGIFGFAGLTSALRGQTETDAEAPILFFSRQIGLSQGQTVPVVAGGRVSGRSGPYSIGFLNIQTGDKASARAVSTNFTVATLKRNILRRSQIGVMVTRRAPSAGDKESNLAGGVDGTFRFGRFVNFVTYYARTKTDRLAGADTSYRGKFDYTGDRYALSLEHTMVGANFNPEIGFVRRVDFRRSYGLARFSPRTRNSRTIRQLTYEASLDYISNPAGTLVQNREAKGLFGIALHNSDSFRIDYRRDYEFLPKNFTIATGVVVPSGGYEYQSVNASYRVGTQRKISGSVNVSRGTLYNGTITTASYSGRIAGPRGGHCSTSGWRLRCATPGIVARRP